METAPQGVSDDPIWLVWRRVVRALPVVRMPIEWLASPSMWRLFGLDYLSGLLKNRNTADVFAVLEPLGERELRRVYALAHLNHRRHEAVSRGFAVGFLTIPASAALTLSELSPQTLRAIATAEGLARWYMMLAYAAVVVSLYMMFAWRARQLLTVIELWLIHRGIDPRSDAPEPGELEPPALA
jgi:hypothetical protein